MTKALSFVRSVLSTAIPPDAVPDLIITARAVNASMSKDDEEELPEMLEPPPGSSPAVQLCYFFAWVNFLNTYYEICGVISDPALRVQCRTEAYAGYLKVVGNCIPE